MRRFLLAAVVVCACGRELTLPPEAQPPRIDSVAPAQGFAGDFVTITGANLADPALQVFFDVRLAVIVTPAEKRDGHTLAVQVPLDVLSTDVSVTTTQGIAKSPQPFTYLGPGHPASPALHADVDLTPSYTLVFPLAGGDAVVLDNRYDTAFVRHAGGALGRPVRVAASPSSAFGPEAAAWVVSYQTATSGYTANLVQIDFTSDPPQAGRKLVADALDTTGEDGSPDGTLFAVPMHQSVRVWTLPAGTPQDVALPGVTADVLAVRFWGNTTLIGITANEPFRVDFSTGAAPVVAVGAPFPDDAKPFVGELAVDVPPRAVGAYDGNDTVRFLSWTGAGAPVLSGNACDPHLTIYDLAITGSGNTALVGDTQFDVIAACDIATGNLVSAQPLLDLGSLAAINDGEEAGLVVAGRFTGVSLLFADGRLLRTEPGNVGAGSMAVDPVCGDVLVGTDFGPLRVSHDTLHTAALDVSVRLTLFGGEGGVVGASDSDLYAYAPPPGCSGDGSFHHVATATNPALRAALSSDGNWVASSDDRFLELLPRSDAATHGAAVSVDYGDSGLDARVNLAYFANQLTATHPAKSGYAISTFAPGTLQEIGSLANPDRIDALRRVRFASSWMMFSDDTDSSGNVVATHVVFWNAAAGAVAEADVPISVAVPAGVSADGFMMVGYSAGPSLSTLLLQVTQNRIVQQPGPQVGLSGEASSSEVYASPDGSRFYVLIGAGTLAVIE